MNSNDQPDKEQGIPLDDQLEPEDSTERESVGSNRKSDKNANNALHDALSQYSAASPLASLVNGKDSVWESVGGVRGLLEALLPSAVFIITFSLTTDVISAILAPIALAIVFTIVRLVTKTPFVQSVSGLIGVLICAGAVLLTGRPEDFYLPGFITNGVYLAACLLSIIFRWPLAGVVIGILRGEGTHWRRVSKNYRTYVLVTLLLAALFALRLIVQIPLSLSGQLALLGTMRVLMGVPFYAAVLWFAWLIVRRVPAVKPQENADGRAS